MKKSSTLLLVLLLASSQVLSRARSGDHGQSGKDMIITADGAVQVFKLSGRDGEGGSNGEDGDDGRCNSYTNDEGQTVSDNVAGDDGEDGGHGGNGGNGGDLTVLFTKITDLKNIHFYSFGGYPGEGGEGGEGGDGCPDGSDGERGHRGDYGSRGSLFLVSKEFHPYQKDNSNELTSLEKLLAGKELVKNIWETLPVNKYLAEDSSYGETFELKKYEYGSAQVILKDPSMIDPRLLKEQVRVHLSHNVTLIKPSEYFMMVAHHSDESPDATLVIERFYNKYDFQSAEFDAVMGTAGNRKIKLKTKVDLVPRPTLSMELLIEVKGRFFKYHEAFKGEVPSDLIKSVKAGYEVEMDKLPLSRKIPAGAKIRLTMKHKLTEMNLTHTENETWVLKVN